MRFDYSLITAIASVTGLFFAILAVWLVHFRHANISSVLGPKIMAYYRDFDREKEKETFCLLAPMTFVNTAFRTGVVLSASLLLYREDSMQERFYMEWDKFAKLDGKLDKWFHDEEPYPLTVLGNSSVTKFTCFYWFLDSYPKLILRKGDYIVTLCFRVQRSREPKSMTYRMSISSDKYDILEELRSNRSSATVYLRLDVELQANQLMTESESKKLLGLTH